MQIISNSWMKFAGFWQARTRSKTRCAQSTIFLVLRGIFWLLCFSGLASLMGCESPEKKAEALSVRNRILDNVVTPDHGLSSEYFLDGVRRVAVQGDYAHPFFVEARLGQMTRYPCTACHEQPLARIRMELDPATKSSHWNIELHHAAPDTMDCQTCHDDTAGMIRLRMLSEGSVSFDHSYRVCAQCHSSQFNDWAGGAHGKRLGGWAEPRVVKNCTGCHNPHKPVLAKSWPVIVPSAPAK